MLRSVLLLLSALLLGSVPVSAEPRLHVVASFSILADLARNVGGELVDVTSLVSPDSDVHAFTPAPSDARKIAGAKLLVVNGFGLEGWLPRLIQSSGSKAQLVTATKAIPPLRLGSESDPHAWQSVVNAKTYVANIRDALSGTDPSHSQAYAANAAAYLARLDELDREVRAAVATIPPERRKVISIHKAFGYFAAEYGIAFIAPVGVSTDTEPSARDIAAIIAQVRAEKIPAVFLENISDDRLIRRIAAETGASIGGTLFSDSLTGRNGPAPTYIDMVRHNIRALASALDH